MKSYLFFLLATISISIYSCKKVNGPANSGPNTNGSSQYVVSTFAGNGTAGLVNGMGQAAEFNHPFGISVDTSGNVFVADEGNNCIRKITPAGLVSTLAGTGAPGYADGPGESALFNAPDGVAVDYYPGNVYVADVNNECIRKISTIGIVTTIAGTPQQEGYADSVGLAAQFAQPTGIAVDISGFPYIIYIADAANECIRAIDYNGRVTTVVGDPGVSGFADGYLTAAKFNNPLGVTTFEGGGGLYVADVNNNRIRAVAGIGYAFSYPFVGDSIPGYADGTGSSAQFAGPTGITMDYNHRNDLYVADAVGQSIRKITEGAEVSIVAGDPLIPGFVDGVGTSAKFSSPTGVAIDRQGNIYVADYINNCIRKIIRQ